MSKKRLVQLTLFTPKELTATTTARFVGRKSEKAKTPPRRDEHQVTMSDP